MNYRHSFHAGNHADVLKHIALLALLRLLTSKDKPLAYLETHAGAGGYALDQASDRPAEWREGIGRLWGATGAPPPVAAYLKAVAAWNEGSDALLRYPGSPGLAADHLRPDDRLRLCEAQPDVAAELKRRLAGHDARVQVVLGDGYQHALLALLPPPERRGLVLVDPPYEAQQAEFDQIIHGLREALKRFATGVYAVWYPIKQAATLAPFMRRLASLPVPSVLLLELAVRAPDSPLRLNGSGLAILNPPWRFDVEAATWLPWVAKRLASGRGADWRCHWLKREGGALGSAPAEPVVRTRRPAALGRPRRPG